MTFVAKTQLGRVFSSLKVQDDADGAGLLDSVLEFLPKGLDLHQEHGLDAWNMTKSPNSGARDKN